METPLPESPSAEARIAELEQRLKAVERPGRKGALLGSVEKYGTLLTLGNLLLGIPAVAISLGAAYFAFVQTDIAQKMQYAGVLPLVSYDTGNMTDDGERLITMEVTNQGVGPAIIRGMELSYQGKAYHNFETMMLACCDTPDEDWSMITSPINGRVLRPGETSRFARVDPELVPKQSFEKFNRERWMVAVKVCYCSVFDECWVIETPEPSPRPVDQCPADWVEYGFPNGVKPGG